MSQTLKEKKKIKLNKKNEPKTLCDHDMRHTSLWDWLNVTRVCSKCGWLSYPTFTP